MNKLILASNSSRRAQLLELAELPFVILPSYAAEDFDESAAPEEVVTQLAERKAKGSFDKAVKEGNIYVIGADTIVVKDEGIIINKPQNFPEAFDMLKSLSGQTHQVITGVCILTATAKVLFHEVTKVTFAPLDDDAINYYIQKHQPYDKAGAYAIQEWIGAIGVTRIDGDYYNVMGLPVQRLVAELKKIGFPLPYTL